MNIFRFISTLQWILLSLLTIVAVFGDFLATHASILFKRAIFDNATHAIIGGLSWLIVCTNFRILRTGQTVLEIACCTFLSSAIDLDHFLAARSLKLKDAVSLQKRPYLHSSTIPVVLVIIIQLLAHYFQSRFLQRLSLIIFTAFASHHTRDATRRGYLFAPWDTSPPIPYHLYIILTLITPYFICLYMKYMPISNHRDYYQENHVDM